MKPHGKAAELFHAFSRINATAFTRKSLLSCPTLSKAPNYGNVLRRYIVQASHPRSTIRSVLTSCLRYCITNTGHFLFLLLTKMYTLILGWKLPEALTPASIRNAKKQCIIVDTFAVLPKLADDGTYTEMYMPGLQSALHSEGAEPVLFFRLYGSRNPITLWKALKVLSRESNSCTEVHLFRWQDWFRMLWHIISYPFALYKLIRSLTHYTKTLPEAYIRSALIQTAGQCILVGEARRIAGFRLGHLLASWNKHTSPAAAPKIISWYENQMLNKTFHRGLHDAEQSTDQHIRVVGAQLFTWPDTLLNNHADDTECSLFLTPDCVAVSGTYFLPEQSNQSYHVGPSLRYTSLFSQQPVTPTADKPILVLLSYHPEATRRTLEMVLPIAQTGGNVVYKFHPATQPEHFAPWLPKQPKLATGSLSDAMRNASVVMGTGSGALAESIILGVPVITIEEEVQVPGLGLQYIPDFGQGELWRPVSHAGEVQNAIDALLQFRESDAYEAKRLAFRDLLFTEPTQERIKAFLAM